MTSSASSALDRAFALGRPKFSMSYSEEEPNPLATCSLSAMTPKIHKNMSSATKSYLKTELDKISACASILAQAYAGRYRDPQGRLRARQILVQKLSQLHKFEDLNISMPLTSPTHDWTALDGYDDRWESACTDLARELQGESAPDTRYIRAARCVVPLDMELAFSGTKLDASGLNDQDVVASFGEALLKTALGVKVEMEAAACTGRGTKRRGDPSVQPDRRSKMWGRNQDETQGDDSEGKDGDEDCEMTGY